LEVSFSGDVVGKLLNFPGAQLVKRDFRVRDESTDPEKGSGKLQSQVLVDSLSVTATGEDDVLASRNRVGDHGDKIEEDLDESRLQTAATSRAPSFREDTPAKRRLMARVWKSYLSPVFAPPSTALIVGLIVANVPPLKALFVQTDFNMPSAPDDKPPLDFFMDICNFGGNATPVLGMILLGAALSRMTIKGLPQGFWKSIVSMATLKLVIGMVTDFGERWIFFADGRRPNHRSHLDNEGHEPYRPDGP
jgi:predicted permease